MLPFLEKLDGDFDMKVNVNFKNSIGTDMTSIRSRGGVPSQA